MKGIKFINKFFLFILLSFIILTPNVFAEELKEDLSQYRTEENKLEGAPYLNPKWIEWNNLTDSEKQKWSVIPQKLIVDYIYEDNNLLKPYDFDNNSLRPTIKSIPTTYDLRDYGYVSPLKNQSSLNLCWDFATVAVMESTALKTLGKSLIFSERQMDYSISNPSTSIVEGYNPYGKSDRILGDAGNFYDVYSLFMGGVSPQLTSVWGNYSTSTNKQNLSKVLNNQHVEYQITNTVDFPYIDMETASNEAKESYIRMIKEHIINYGGVYVSTITPDSRGGSCYNSQYNMSYWNKDCTTSGTDYWHAMLIIGWNDTYGPDYNGDGVGDGAWILKNSWGNQNPYPYSSYYSLNSTYNGIMSIQEKNWDRSYDSSDFGSLENGKRVYYKDANTIEKLNRISFRNGSSLQNHDYKIYISTTGNDSDKELIGTVTTNNPGMYSLEIDTLLLENDRFNIYVESSISTFHNPTEISAFTSVVSINNDIKVKTIIENSEIVVNDNGVFDRNIYSITENISTGEKISYKIFKDNTDLTSSFEIKNNFVINDNVNASIKYIGNSIDEGTYTIKSYYNGSFLDEFDFNIIGKKIRELSLSETNIKIEAGETYNIVATISDIDALNKSLKWESSDNSIITLSKSTTSGSKDVDKYTNTIIANDRGEAKIVVSTLDGSSIYQEIVVDVIKLEGEGTAQNPYNIYNKYELNLIREHPTSYYELKNDIEFSDSDFKENGYFYNNGFSWEPITNFRGHLNGNNYTISNLNVKTSNSTLYSGMFAELNDYSSIKNLKLYNFKINFGTYPKDTISYAGVLTAKSNNSNFDNITVTNSSITNNNYGTYAGGISGYDNNSNFSNCSTSGLSIINSGYSFEYAGGIVGYSLYGKYANLSNSGQFNSNISGGIVGYNENGTFINIKSSGHNPKNTVKTFGGLAGILINSTLLSSEYNSGITRAKDYSAGIVGKVSNSLIMDIGIPLVYITGSKTSSSTYFGGVFGYSENNYIKNIYNRYVDTGSNSSEKIKFIASSNSDKIYNYYYQNGSESLIRESNETILSNAITDKSRICSYFDCNNIWNYTDSNSTLKMNNYNFDTENINILYGDTLNINIYPFNQLSSSDYEINNSNSSAVSINTSKGTITGDNYGTATITFTSNIGSKHSKVFNVNVVEEKSVESIQLNRDVLELFKGDSEVLEFTINPSDALNKKVTWSSSNEQVAEVDQNGKITAINRGTTIITVTSEDGGYTDTCKVTVREPKIIINEKSTNSNYDGILYSGYGGIVIVPITTQDIEENSKLILKYYKDDIEITNAEVSNIFKIGGNVVCDNKVNLQIGVMTSASKGKYKIEVSSENAETKSFEFDVVAPILVDGIEADDITLIINQNKKVNYIITNDDALNKKVSFSIRNKDESLTTLVATVDGEGYITANHLGEAILIIEAQDGSGVKKEINITVIDDFDIKTNKYFIDENLKINKIYDKLILEDFIKDFEVNLNINIKIYKNDTEIDYTKHLGTGYKLKTYSNDNLKNEYTLIVSGDLNGDGSANATDILAQKLHILNKSLLSNEYFTAGDINEDGKVNATDILHIKMYILGKYSTVWGK